MQRCTSLILDISVERAIVRAGTRARRANTSGGHGAMSVYQVGFIGIGNMGWPMAKNLLKAGHNILKAGHKLAVFDLDKVGGAKVAGAEPKAVAVHGAAALAKSSRVISNMLPTGPIV